MKTKIYHPYLTSIKVYIVCIITFSSLSFPISIYAQTHPIIDESGLDLGYVDDYIYGNRSFYYDFTFVHGASYPANMNSTGVVGMMNYDTTTIKIGKRSGYLLDGRASMGGLPTSIFRPMTVKKVYYGDTDAGVTIRETDLLNANLSLNNRPFYVFSVYDKLDAGQYVYVTTYEFCLFGSCMPGTMASYTTHRTRRRYGSKETVNGSIEKYNYVFKVSDWVNNSFLGSLEYTIENPTEQLKRLNSGVEVYLVSTQFTKSEVNDDEFQPPPHSLRTIVYPKKPLWKQVSIPQKICKGTVIDLRNWVDMKGLTFNGKFEVISGGNSLITGNHTLNTGGVSGFIDGKKELTIRCYPYFKEGVSGFGYPDNMWNVYMDVKVMVYDTPALTDIGVQIMCSSAGQVELSRYTPAGGIYTGSYISQNKLNVTNAVAANNYNISTKYTYTDLNGCKSEILYDQQITKEQQINFNLPTQTCKETAINLNTITSPSGGVFLGNGVNAAGYFNPINAGYGIHQLTYSLGGVCPTSSVKSIEVMDLQPENIIVSSIPKQCRDGSKLDLMPFVSYTGGKFYGTGVENNRYLDPSKATIGSNLIRYEVGIGVCKMEKSFNIEVANSVDVSFSAISRICEAKEVNLQNHVSVSGGLFNGPGVSNGYFSSEAAGIGTHTIFYTISSGGCSGTASTNVIVADLLPSNVYFEPLPRMCKSDVNNFIDLRGYLKNHSGGTFSGVGVEGNYFYPSKANVGSNIIYYNYGQSVCAKTTTTEVIIYNQDNISFYNVPVVCYNQTIDLMQFVTPQGGTFFGPGVSQNRYFNSGMTGKGTFTITYKYFNGNCFGEVTKNITVDAILPTNIIFNDLPNVCKGGDAVNLREYVNSSLGTFSGNGVVTDYLNPSQAIVGINVVNYTIQEGSCKSTYSNTIKVINDPQIIFNDIGNICVDNTIDLDNYIYPYGGTFSGNGVSGRMFNPAVTGIGETYVNYEVDGAGGCSNVMSKKLTVSGLLPVTTTFSNIPDLCHNSEPIELTNYVEPKTGYFTGNGVVGTKFDPKNSGSGTFIVKYTIESGGCKRELSRTITVKSQTPILFNDIQDVCKDDEIELSQYVYPTGGVFSGKGVTDGFFYPEVAGVGENFVYYSLNNNGCTTVTSKKIVVKATIKDFTFSANMTQCKNDDPIDLWGYVSGYGGTNGTFSGNGVVESIFNPLVANIGGNLIKFKISENGCTMEATSTISILQSPSVTFNAIEDVCTDREIGLSQYVYPTGGVFSGLGVRNDTLYAREAGIGNKYVYYQYTGVNGCKDVKQKIVNIKALLPPVESIIVQPIPQMCILDNPINLRDFINRTDGIFVGSGVVGNLFDPKIAGAGSFEITYRNTSGTCTVERKFTISVLATPQVIFNKINDICFESKIPLSQYVYPTGGTFSGKGVKNDTLDVKLAGIGDHNIYYTYSEGGCPVSVSQVVKVKAAIPPFSITDLPSLCKNADPVNLNGYLQGYEGSNGYFSGVGVVGDVFSPNSAGVGGNLIKYTVSEGGCTREATKTVTVLANPSVTFNAIEDVCTDREIDLSQYVYPTGGVFSGKGVTDGIFYPNIAGAGINYVYYSVIGANNCSSSVQKTINVKAIIPDSIRFNAIETICKRSNPLNLRQYVNTDLGSFTGNGVIGDIFYPNEAQTGNNTISFKISQGGCLKEFSRVIIVKDEGEVYFSQISPICYDQPIDLRDYAFPSGGVFSGNGVSGTMFNPAIAGIGTHKISYVVNSGAGCYSTIDQFVKINSLIEAQENIEINLINDLCVNSPFLDLRNYVSPQGGQFTGVGVQGNQFVPSVAGPGVHIITYTIGQLDCYQSKAFSIKVLGNGTVNIDPISLVCGNVIDLTEYAFPTGGVFSGKYVENNQFMGNNAPNGSSSITYTVETNEGCYVSKEFVVSNFKMPSVNIKVSENNIMTGGVMQFIPEGITNLSLFDYEWRFGDGGWSKEAKPWHYYYHSGVFDIKLNLGVKENECYKNIEELGAVEIQNSEGLKIYFKEKLIYQETENEYISVSPNPFKDIITIQGIDDNQLVRIYDLTGKVVIERLGGGEINAKNLLPGVYLIVLPGEKNTKFKIIKE